jgi:hypothetical protein
MRAPVVRAIAALLRFPITKVRIVKEYVLMMEDMDDADVRISSKFIPRPNLVGADIIRPSTNRLELTDHVRPDMIFDHELIGGRAISAQKGGRIISAPTYNRIGGAFDVLPRRVRAASAVVRQLRHLGRSNNERPPARLRPKILRA